MSYSTQPFAFVLSEFELLRAANAISSEKGGCHLGTIGSVEGCRNEQGEIELFAGATYRNQWLISVELHDDAAPFGESVPPGQHQWRIRMGFCQTQIQRAPNGGFTLELSPLLLSMCPTVEHVFQLFECMLGKSAEREASLQRWHNSVESWFEQRTPIALDIAAFIRDDVLAHQLALGRID